MTYKVPERNFENISFQIIRKVIDPIYNTIYDELCLAYYNKTEFRNYGILTTEKFEKLQALLWFKYDITFHQYNISLPEDEQIPTARYANTPDGLSYEVAIDEISKLEAEGYILEI